MMTIDEIIQEAISMSMSSDEFIDTLVELIKEDECNDY